MCIYIYIHIKNAPWSPHILSPGILLEDPIEKERHLAARDALKHTAALRDQGRQLTWGGHQWVKGDMHQWKTIEKP